MTPSKLYTYLKSRFKNGLTYSDAIVLCRGIYVYANVLPDLVPPEQLSREEIACSFASFAQTGGIDVSALSEKDLDFVITQEHWLSLIDDLFRKKVESLDIRQVEAIIAAPDFSKCSNAGIA